MRQHIHIGLRPPQANNAPQDSHQPVLNVRQLRARGRTNSINHHQCVHDVPAGGEVVRPYIAGTRIDGVGKAIRQVSSAFAEQRIGDRPVVVVNDSDGNAGR